jgi:hypothetical protein
MLPPAGMAAACIPGHKRGDIHKAGLIVAVHTQPDIGTLYIFHVAVGCSAQNPFSCTPEVWTHDETYAAHSRLLLLVFNYNGQKVKGMLQNG